MRDGWKQTTLGEVVSFKGGGTPSTEKPSYWNGDIPWVSPKDMKSSEVSDSIDKITLEAIENSAASLIPKHAILIVVRSGILARTIPVGITTRPLAVNQDIKALCPKDDVDPRYLHYFMLMSERVLLKLVTRGATVHRLSTDSLKALNFARPPLVEQQRIVAVLDEAFAALAMATANAEKSLRDARELFESRLSCLFDQAAKESAPHRLGDIVTRLTNGYVGPTRDIYVQNGVPYLLARHVRDNRLEFDRRTFVSDEFNEKNKKSKLKVGDVLLVQSGHIGHSAVVGPEHEGHNCHAMIVITPTTEKLSGHFLSLYFGSPQMKNKFEEIRSGSTVPHLTCGLVRELMIPLPSIAEQQTLVAELKELEADTARLASLAHVKLLALSQLKQSILQRAFAGELISYADTAPIRVVDTRTASFAASVLLIAYERHRIAGRDHTFGHKKAQKLLHLIDAAAGIDLGRDPLKDAAGPNDFEHMLRAIDWAEQRVIFKFNKSDNRYIFQRLQHYERGLKDATRETEQYSKGIADVIDLLLPMNSEEAEIVATVYAAWNNLIVKSKPIDNEAIVREAREDWHLEKMAIPRHKFFDAIALLKNRNMVPNGQAKLVREKYLI